jgi:DNA-binding SARP family transcriptional activator
VEFRILGPVQALRDDGPVDLGGARRVALLAALLVRANVTCPADYLIDVLWGDHPPAAASATLQSHIAHLRRVLEPDRSARRPPTILKSVQSGYVLAVAPEDFDAAVFERLLRSGQGGAGRR